MRSLERELILKPLSQGTLPSPPKSTILFSGKAPGGFLFVWFYILFILCATMCM